MTTAILCYSDQRTATFTCSFGAADVSSYQLVGTKGSLRMDPAYEFAEALEMHVMKGGKPRRQKFGRRDQFGPELAYFSDCVLRGKEPEPGGTEGMLDVRIIRALYASARMGSPLVLEPVARRDARPDPGQRIDRPPVRETELVHAEPPSR